MKLKAIKEFFKNSDAISLNKFKKDLNGFLLAELEFKYMEMLNSKNRTCCPDITRYLDENIITEIVGKKHFA